MFRSYEHLVESETESRLVLNPGPAPQVPILAVVRATTAAPTYFKSMRIGDSEFLDAFRFGQNPTLYAFDEVSQMHGSTPDSVTLTVSIGSGDLSKRPSPSGGKTKTFRAVHARIIYSLLHYDEAHDQMLRNEHRLRGTRRESLYERFNVQSGLQDVSLGEWKMKKPLLGSKTPVNLTFVKIQSATHAYLEQPEVQTRLRAVAKRLVKNRRERAQDTAKWNVVAGID